MTIQKTWTPSFSDADPDFKSNTLFTGLPQNYYIRVDRDATPHIGGAPVVNVVTSKVGGAGDQNEATEGQTLELSGNSCTLTASNATRQAGDTVQASVTVTWQPDPF
ncbi:hypothetical protein JQ557_25130 [Bradyrhizobium sp. U87765 SZCCT0131]|uniref:hypothetical protein n=1 Tax=unclassified Bradyrhizobium TaxID=2631580 RepID=UPI001BACDE36|nr:MULTISPECIES: hypothetical protein [unclassified Bradyrhizobium]MBR1221307.1 hypothetical protein [Bradyrhizobium sp. U87765 SZCCT0131]MBR1264770.1 hypothetical protein [Bradyrhizobium sp. U87765 SZCCT0134]MBR1304324.1 hypothetical protein [Bradyrhizobium sp. U87765 SZCCT0110]MBR1322819.1 hypothetical protein [Bradyrhizobium sp. U87765 SZCCT0109]MBR1346253.1 hypothetical protein [Bradyrhizobium sp. U87765 SZCCT0048]